MADQGTVNEPLLGRINIKEFDSILCQGIS